MKRDVVAFVHAKGTSERITAKNLRTLGDMPLFCHAVTNALGSELVTKVVVDSDSDEILAIGEKHGATPLKRPAELANNQVTGDELAYWQATNYPLSEIILQVVPTSPFIRSSSVDGAIRMISTVQVDSVVGVFAEALYLWVDGKPAYFSPNERIPNSSEMRPIVYETTGLYVNRTQFVLANKRRVNINSCAPYYLSKIEAIDINTPEDFEFAEIVLKGLRE